MKKAGFVLFGIFILFFCVSLASGAVLNVCPTCNYTKIQDAINNATAGDTINVSAGSYNEQININKSINLIGSPGNSPGPGPNPPVLNGNSSIGSAITIVGGVSNVTVQGFEITNYTNSGTSGGIGSGILAWNSVGTSDIRVLDNHFHDLGWSAILVGNEGQSLNDNWLVKDNIISNVAFYSIELTNTKNSRVIENIVTGGVGVIYTPSLTATSDDGILIQSQVHVGSGLNFDNITVKKNIVNGTFERAGIEILAWDSTNSLTSELDDINVINNNIFGAERGIYMFSVGANANISNLNIINNIINGNDDGIQIRSFGGGTHGSINIERNDIINSVGADSGIRIRSGTSAESIRVHFNNIINNSLYGINNEGTSTLNAEYNYWGSCDGPGAVGPGSGDNVSVNVTYTPWLGICITNKTNVTCAFETKNVTLSADLNGTEINSVWFSYTINNTNYNKTAIHVGGDKYRITIPSSNLTGNGGQNITWNVYANDSIKTYKNGEKTFYVRKKTKLSVNGTFGLNGWYVTEPLFTLIKDTLGGNNYYQWDSTGALLYTAPFGLENIPNPPEESAGTLELNWWTDFGVVCGNESKQSKMFYIDLTNPLITNLKPTNNSVVYNNLKPEISAYLDEVYGSNSGIDTEIVQMSLNGNPVPAIVNLTDTLDAIITYIPISNLNLGKHNVSVNVTDNAGRNSELTWFFYINITPVFTMQVNSPQSKIYDSKRIPFNITLSENVEKIEYMNLDDKTPRWRNLCRNCNEYGFVREKTKTLKEGWNNITIKATDFFGQSKEENRSLFIDSKEPRIHRTEPRRNSVVNGSEFYIKYTEDNLKNITLFWNPNKTLNCSSGKNQECTTNANLSSYNGQWIEYWFEVSDSINKVSSSETRVFVDTTPPELNVSSPKNLVNGTYGRKVLFNITVSEPVLLEYYDNSVASPRWRTLCARCSEYGNSRAKTQAFSRGEHNIQIRAVDEAGNSDVEERSFEVEY